MLKSLTSSTMEELHMQQQQHHHHNKKNSNNKNNNSNCRTVNNTDHQRNSIKDVITPTITEVRTAVNNSREDIVGQADAAASAAWWKEKPNALRHQFQTLKGKWQWKQTEQILAEVEQAVEAVEKRDGAKAEEKLRG